MLHDYALYKATINVDIERDLCVVLLVLNLMFS